MLNEPPILICNGIKHKITKKNMENTKKCSKCGEVKSLDEFNKDKTTKDGVGSRCKVCRRANDRANYDKQRAYRKKKLKQYYKENTEERKAYNKQYRQANLDKCKAYDKLYSSLDTTKDRTRERERERYANDDLYRAKAMIRGMINKAITNETNYSNTATEDFLGISVKEFKQYLESKFESWMTWDNRGLYNGEENFGWDIDHIVPLKEAKTITDVINLNNYKNLQPLCSKTNRYIKK